jgi:hypothetical protein
MVSIYGVGQCHVETRDSLFLHLQTVSGSHAAFSPIIIVIYTSDPRQLPRDRQLYISHYWVTVSQRRMFLRQQRIQLWGTVYSARSVPRCCKQDELVERVNEWRVSLDSSVEKSQSVESCCGWATGTVWEPRGSRTSAVGSRNRKTGEERNWEH